MHEMQNCKYNAWANIFSCFTVYCSGHKFFTCICKCCFARTITCVCWQNLCNVFSFFSYSWWIEFISCHYIHSQSCHCRKPVHLLPKSFTLLPAARQLVCAVPDLSLVCVSAWQPGMAFINLFFFITFTHCSTSKNKEIKTVSAKRKNSN